VKKLIKEPFIHFILIGGLLFALYQLFGNKSEQYNNTIEISELDIKRATDAWQERWSRLPSDSELKNVIEQQVREEVFYREALALDLGKNDPVIKRRLSEKMIFIANDLLVPEQATDQQLTDFMQQHPHKFSKPLLISFKQFYFNPDLHSSDLSNELERVKFTLNSNTQDTSSTVLSDDFNGESEYTSMPLYQVARHFGQKFTAEIETLPVGTWSGPIASGYGMHIIKVTDRAESTLMPLQSIKDKVLLEWQAEQKKQANDSLYAKLRENYKIVFQSPSKNIEK
jgi:hypothetical protein